jgi:hypothetical protein
MASSVLNGIGMALEKHDGESVKRFFNIFQSSEGASWVKAGRTKGERETEISVFITSS